VEKISDSQHLQNVLDKTIIVLEESKKEIFSIAETSHNEYENIKKEIIYINTEINRLIDKLDNLVKINRLARIRLMEVSRDVYKYNEDDIKQAYQRAEETSVEMAVLKEKEDQLKKSRKDLEYRLINLKKTIENAENLISKVSVIKDYLMGELNRITNSFDDLKQKQQLAIRIIQAQEEERKRISREIHDGPAQSIANLVFRVELIQHLMEKDLIKAQNELDDLKDMVRGSLHDVRKIIYDLRPMGLDDLGLIPTLKRYIDKYIKETGITIDFLVTGSKKRLSPSYEITLFRLVQEALNNLYKHANTYNGKVCLEYTSKQVNLLIIDYGKGFELDNKSEDKFGLINMQERCDLLGGNLEINSGLNKGTRININIPIKSREENNNEENQGFNI
jgi:two-component system, NarL family, sensor histidine kinase DegS